MWGVVTVPQMMEAGLDTVYCLALLLPRPSAANIIQSVGDGTDGKEHGTDVTRQKPILRLPVNDIPACSSRLGGKSNLGHMQPFAPQP